MIAEPNNVSLSQTLAIIGTWLIVVATIITAIIKIKERKEMKPTITKIKYLGKGSFRIWVVNNKASRVAMSDILYAKKSRFFYKKPSKANWNYPTEVEKILLATTQTRTATFIEDQREFVFSIPNFDPTTTYKVVVKCEGVSCHKHLPSIRDSIEN